MKNLSGKSIAIGAGLSGASAAIAYAAPFLMELYSGKAAVVIVLSMVPTVLAYLTDARKKVEGQ